MKHGIQHWVLVALLLGNHGVAGAQVFTWTDEQGRKHFTDESSTPESRRVKRVEVPPTNIANRFVPTPPTVSNTLPEESSPTKTEAAQPGPSQNRPQNNKWKTRAFTRDECAAQKQAYETSAACFATCSSPVRANGNAQMGRNNANCGHCQQVTAPNC